MTHFSPLLTNGRGGALGLGAATSQVPNQSCRLTVNELLHAHPKPHPFSQMRHGGRIEFNFCHTLSSGEILGDKQRSVRILEIQGKQELNITKHFLHARHLA